MPAIPVRRKARPFAKQSALKHPRTHAKLRFYARRRMEYSICTVIVLCTFFSRYLPELYECRAERRRIAARPGNKLRQRRHRKLQSILLRIARLEAKRTVLAAEIAKIEERIRVKEWQKRKHAPAHQGTVDGFGAVTPLDEAQLKALSFPTRYRLAYLEAVAEKKRWLTAMAQNGGPGSTYLKPTPQPRSIQL